MFSAEVKGKVYRPFGLFLHLADAAIISVAIVAQPELTRGISGNIPVRQGKIASAVKTAGRTAVDECAVGWRRVVRGHRFRTRIYRLA